MKNEMCNEIPKDLMKELDELMADSGLDSLVSKQQIKKQIKAAAINGGPEKVIAGSITGRRIDFVKNRIYFGIEEQVLTAAKEGLRKYKDIFIQCASKQEAIAVSRGISSYETIVVFDKASLEVVGMVYDVDSTDMDI